MSNAETAEVEHLQDETVLGLRTHVLSITVRHGLEHPSLEFAITFAVTHSP